MCPDKNKLDITHTSTDIDVMHQFNCSETGYFKARTLQVHGKEDSSKS